ncbi:uncharacterized protein LOC116789481 [Chiroxiphia lanceolata]|uniref:uncharacterized protein LOC116789481 n=1 Tax=Chiroxiphia lanceolata TaxID=296741 RepID=UPI0013CE7E78|nr:uncharacterized protein LOC116789481 [Chiroxiphia lanceolata]
MSLDCLAYPDGGEEVPACLACSPSGLFHLLEEALGGDQSPGARGGRKERATKGHLSGSLERCCRLTGLRGLCRGSCEHCCLGVARGAGVDLARHPAALLGGALHILVTDRLPTGSNYGSGRPFLGLRAPPLPHPLASRAIQFSWALSVAQASEFQRQRCYLKPLLFASLTPTATSCCRSMRAHPGPASQRKAANEEQVQRRLFFVLFTKQLPKQSPSALHRTAIYSSPSLGHAGGLLQTVMPWDPFSGQFSDPSAPRADHKYVPSLHAPLPGTATRTAGSARARERVGFPWGQLPTQPWQPVSLGELLHLGSIAASLLFLPVGECTYAAAAPLPALGAGLHSCGTQQRPECPIQTLHAQGSLPPGLLITVGICCTPVPGAALSSKRL